MVTKFGKYINSSDGHEIALLIGSFLDKKSKFKYFSCSKLLIRQRKIKKKQRQNFITNKSR